MKTLADLKRAIKPGVRIHCHANTYRPELNGHDRVVTRIQTNGYWWKHAETVLHTPTTRGCSCGWSMSDWRGVEDFEAQHAGHVANSRRDSWSQYGKSGMFRFFGTGVYEMQLFPNDPRIVRLELL